MDVLSRDELRAMMQQQEKLCVSIYMPTHRSGMDTQQNSIRFKNLLRKAEKDLAASSLRSLEVESFLEPAHKLLNESLFWSHQGDGLALFLSRKVFRCYRLPLRFEELMVIGDRFHVKPLFPLLTGDGQFYVLAFSQNQVRLLRGTRLSVSDLDPEGIPRSLADALRYDDPEKQLQFRTNPAGPGRGGAFFHGHGGGFDEARTNILRYFQQIDRGLHDMLKNDHGPLVLAGVDYLFPIYREANTYPHLMEEGIPGNPEEISTEELHQKAWAIVRPHFQASEERAADEHRRLIGTSKASERLEEILPAACQGRIDVLFVPIGVQQWGSFDPESGEISLHDEAQPGDEDLLNSTAIQTFQYGGTVYAVARDRMPGDAIAAAVFRY